MWIFPIFHPTVWIFSIFITLRFASAQLVSFHPFYPPQCHLSSDQRHHAVVPCHTYFSLSQDKLVAFASSFDNALCHHLTSRAKIKALNLHHRCRAPPNRLTLLLYCYKKIILILIILSITRSHLYFISFLIRAPHRHSSIRRRHSLLSLSYTHCSSAQWHSRWWASRHSFIF